MMSYNTPRFRAADYSRTILEIQRRNRRMNRVSMNTDRDAEGRVMRIEKSMRAFALPLIATLALLPGCDDKRTLVPITAPQPATQPVAPTTQELLQGEQVRVALKVIPFWVTVPKGWEMKTQAGVVVVQGPTPTGTAQLQVGRHIAPIAQHAELLVQGATRDAANKPGPYTLADVREISGLKLLETRNVGPTQPTPALDATGKTIADTTTRMDWKTTVFLPEGRETIICDVQFIDLTR